MGTFIQNTIHAVISLVISLLTYLIVTPIVKVFIYSSEYVEYMSLLNTLWDSLPFIIILSFIVYVIINAIRVENTRIDY